jgi:hypothetical protein
MKIYDKDYFKKAIKISSLVEFGFCVIMIVGSLLDGHAGFILGMALHFPSSLVGIIVGERIQADSGALAFATATSITVFLQFLLILIFAQIALKKLDLVGGMNRILETRGYVVFENLRGKKFTEKCVVLFFALIGLGYFLYIAVCLCMVFLVLISN